MHKTDTMNKMNKSTLNKDQRGFVAFFVTIMVMIIFGVLILSFSQISNREATSALNRNLSTNALYAAESGINDAYTALRNSSAPTAPSGCSGSPTFSYTGGAQTYTVPAGVNTINVTLCGGAGGDSNPGGYGGETTGTLNVKPGDILKVIVAGAGSDGQEGQLCVGGAGGYGGYGGGGNGGYGDHSGNCHTGYSYSDPGGGGGGGASQIITNSGTELAIAAGGGGNGGVSSGAGAGGGEIGGAGVYALGNGADYPGPGGTQSSGGISAGDKSCGGGEDGSSLTGGNGACTGGGTGAGGGGSGYYGGAGGVDAAGGGGSALVPPGGTTTSGVNNGNGSVSITPGSGSEVPLQQTTTCDASTYGNPVLNSNTKYTCILVSNSPANLNYQCPKACPNNTIPPIYIHSGGNPISQLTVHWSDSNKTNSGCSIASSPFLTSNTWPANCLEVLRVDLVPFNSGATTLSSLQSSVKTFFLYPQSSAAATENFSLINNGSIYSANCPTSSGGCSFTISGLLVPGPSYYARVQYYYADGDNVNISFTGADADGGSIEFTSSQLQIDATGLSGTVLKRVSASIALSGSEAAPFSLPAPPSYALQSYDSICKSFLQYQGSLYEIIPANKPGDITDTTSTASLISSNKNSDLCNPI